MNLWYLFSTAEQFKLKTFLSGGLWCSDIGSIVGFGEDAEGSGPQGLFVSCWHASEDDPTSRAWQIFGGDGDGFAIRTTVDELQSYATTTGSSAIAARLGPVTYVPEGGSISDPAFEVLGHHRELGWAARRLKQRRRRPQVDIAKTLAETQVRAIRLEDR